MKKTERQVSALWPNGERVLAEIILYQHLNFGLVIEFFRPKIWVTSIQNKTKPVSVSQVILSICKKGIKSQEVVEKNRMCT